jgi:hypothetical protein
MSVWALLARFLSLLRSSIRGKQFFADWGAPTDLGNIDHAGARQEQPYDELRIASIVP